MMGNLREYIIYNLKKRWKRRTPIFLTYAFSATNIVYTIGSFFEKVFIILFITGIMILIDEWVKEGYFFDPRDLGGLTHETLLVMFIPFLLPIALYLRRKINYIYKYNRELIREKMIKPMMNNFSTIRQKRHRIS